MRRSACGDGASFFSCSFARTKLSILVFGQPFAAAALGAGMGGDGLERPPLAPLLERHPFVLRRRRSHCRSSRARIGRATRNPLLEVGQHGFRKFAARGHLRQRIAVAESGDEAAFGWLPRHDRRTRHATLQQPFPGVEHQAALRRRHLGAVAAVALLGEDRPDFGLEKLNVRRLRRHRRARSKQTRLGRRYSVLSTWNLLKPVGTSILPRGAPARSIFGLSQAWSICLLEQRNTMSSISLNTPLLLPHAGRSATTSGTGGLSPELLSESARRLRSLALLYAFTFFMAAFFPSLLFAAWSRGVVQRAG